MSYSSTATQLRSYSQLNNFPADEITYDKRISYCGIYGTSNLSTTEALNWNKLAIAYKCINPPKSNSKAGVEAMIGGNSNRVNFMNIMFDNRIYSLNTELSIIISHSEEYFLIDYNPLNIYVCEKTRDEAISDFYERFDMLWVNYVEDTETPMSEDALILRDKLHRLVKEVTCV